MLSLHRNQNCYGLSPSVREVLASVRHSAYAYPEAELVCLKRTLSRRFGVGLSQVVCGAGSSLILREALRHVSTLADARLFVSSPTYAIAESQGLPVCRVAMDAGLSVDLSAMQRQVAQHAGVAVVYLSNPDCHSGSELDNRALAEWIAGAGEQVYFIIDEAYMEFVARSTSSPLASVLAGNVHNLLVLRTFSKAYGLAGLRVGYGLVSGRWMQGFHTIVLEDTLGLPGARAALEALDDESWLEQARLMVELSRQMLVDGVTMMNLQCSQSSVNFVLHRMPPDAQRFVRQLQRQDLRIAYPIAGLDGWCRVTVGSLGEVSCYLKALRDSL